MDEYIKRDAAIAIIEEKKRSFALSDDMVEVMFMVQTGISMTHGMRLLML